MSLESKCMVSEMISWLQLHFVFCYAHVQSQCKALYIGIGMGELEGLDPPNIFLEVAIPYFMYQAFKTSVVEYDAVG